MLTFAFRPLPVTAPSSLSLDHLSERFCPALADLTDANVIQTSIVIGDRGMARRLRWHTHQSRNRVVLECTFHPAAGLMTIDASLAADTHHHTAALFHLCQLAGQAGYKWAAMWRAAADPMADSLGFREAASWHQDEAGPRPPIGRQIVAGGLVLEWLNPTPRIMSRLLNFGADCSINWESLVATDLMVRETPVTYLEVRHGNQTAALCRLLRGAYLPGMDGYDPRAKRAPVEFDIESIEVHPDYKGQGLASILVSAVKSLARPVFTLDTYRKAEAFWEKMQFRYDPRRSSRERSNIFVWQPRTSRAQVNHWEPGLGIAQRANSQP